MELITGKAKEVFLKHCKQTESFMNTYADIYLHALIIDWLDSVGIYVETFVLSQDREIGFCFNISGNEIFEDGMWYDTRTQATQEAIKKAVEIYNKGA